jgi:hypothetical protein
MTHPTFPEAMTLHDVEAMRIAVQLAAAEAACEPDEVAPIVFKLYQRGLTDTRPLSRAASMLASSRAYRRVRH